MLLEMECVQRGHSTAGMAGRIAGQVNAGLLVLHHLSAKTLKAENEGRRETVKDQIEQARIAVQKSIAGSNTQKGNTRVVAAYDFMEIVVPWAGFVGDGAAPHHRQEAVCCNVKNHDDGTSESSTNPQSLSDRVLKWFV
jgi:hypothetical protein